MMVATDAGRPLTRRWWRWWLMTALWGVHADLWRIYRDTGWLAARHTSDRIGLLYLRLFVRWFGSEPLC